jgi:hypothetical protein
MPAQVSSWPTWVAGDAYHDPAWIPAASARMSFLPAAISPSSAMDSDRLRCAAACRQAAPCSSLRSSLSLLAMLHAYRNKFYCVRSKRFHLPLLRFFAIRWRWCSRQSLQTQPRTCAGVLPCLRSLRRDAVRAASSAVDHTSSVLANPIPG